MSKKNVKKLVASKSSKPSLSDLVSGKSEAVAKAVAERRATNDKALAKAAAQEKVAAKKDGKAAKETTRKPGSGALIREMLMKGETPERIVAAVLKAFPDRNTTKGDVAWNKWDMKRKGVKVPETRKVAAKA